MAAAVNPLRGEAVLSAGGAEWRLDFSVNTFCVAEHASGKTTDEIVSAVAGAGGNLTMVRLLVWAALQKHHATVSLAEAGELMSDAGMPEVRRVVTDGLASAFNLKKEGGDEENPPLVMDGTGSQSINATAKPEARPTRSGAKRRKS